MYYNEPMEWVDNESMEWVDHEHIDWPDWSMFSENWSFATSLSTRGEIESIDPYSMAFEFQQDTINQTQNEMPSNLKKTFVAQEKATEKENMLEGSAIIVAHPSSKLSGEIYNIDVDFAPKSGDELTDIAALLAIKMGDIETLIQEVEQGNLIGFTIRTVWD